MKELIVKPSFSSKITVNSEYLEKQLLELSIKGGYHYELFENALNQPIKQYTLDNPSI